MKKIILAVAVLASLVGTVQAQGYHGGYRGGNTTVVNNYGGGYRGGCYNCGGGWGNGQWVGPALAGMAVGAVIGAVTAPPVVVAPPPAYYPQPAQGYYPAYGGTPPVYSPRYPGPSCTPAYDQFGRYLGCL